MGHRSRISQGHSGPKSGGRRLYISPMKFIILHATVGARVSSAVASEEGLRGGGLHLPRGKHSGPAQPGRRDTAGIVASITHSEKRAYKGACKRANASIQEGTLYRGKWHSRKALASLYQPNQPKPTHVPLQVRMAARSRCVRPARPVPQIRVFSWNVGGLSSSIYQELLAWLSVNGPWDAVILQETHWKEVSDYHSGEWCCIHTTGHQASPAESDRSAGILIMISKRTFADITVSEHVAGRLLQVQAQHKLSQLPVDFLGVYQHVHRTHQSPAKNRQLRGIVWHKMQQVLNALPARHLVVIAGDMNATVDTSHPHIGMAIHNVTSRQLILAKSCAGAGPLCPQHLSCQTGVHIPHADYQKSD